MKVEEGKYSLVTNKVTISKLKKASNFTLNFTGQIGIANDAVMLSVRFGNMNKDKDWIIDFSDKTGDAPGTEIRLTELIKWINEKNKAIVAAADDGSTAPEVALVVPAGVKPEDVEKIKNYTILFKEFHFNITKKTFKIEVVSGQDQEITFGAFTIKKVGLLVTNEEWTEEEKKAIE